MTDLEAKFNEAAKKVKDFKPSKTIPNERLLEAYGLYKQVNFGDCNTGMNTCLERVESAYSRQSDLVCSVLKGEPSGTPGLLKKVCNDG